MKKLALSLLVLCLGCTEIRNTSIEGGTVPLADIEKFPQRTVIVDYVDHGIINSSSISTVIIKEKNTEKEFLVLFSSGNMSVVPLIND